MKIFDIKLVDPVIECYDEDPHIFGVNVKFQLGSLKKLFNEPKMILETDYPFEVGYGIYQDGWIIDLYKDEAIIKCVPEKIKLKGKKYDVVIYSDVEDEEIYAKIDDVKLINPLIKIDLITETLIIAFTKFNEIEYKIPISQFYCC